MNVRQLLRALEPLDGDLPVQVAIPGPRGPDTGIVAVFTYPTSDGTWVNTNPELAEELPYGFTILAREVF